MPEKLRSNPIPTRLLRPLALVLMVLGAAGFIAARVLYGDQVLYMVVSTLIVFAGLGLMIYQRKNSAPQPPANQRTPAPAAPPAQKRSAAARPPAALVSMTDFVIDKFKQQGARVTVETRRPERSILVITAPGGVQSIAIVHEGSGAVDIPDLRALLALVSNHNSRVGFYVTEGYFTPQASAWVSDKPLRLVEKGHFELLVIP